MLSIRERIKEHQQRLARIPFLQRLETGAARVEDGRQFAADLSFWVMTFQDALRLNRASVKQPDLREIADRHLEEDSGHEQWFWHDARTLSAIRSPEWYFGSEAARVRELSFEIVSEVFRAQHDESRIALILTLEATGEEFFPRVVSYFERCRPQLDLKYFAQTHRQVEQGHDVFEAETNHRLAQIVLSLEQRTEALAIVARVFQAFENLGAFLESRLLGSAPETPLTRYVREAEAQGLELLVGAAAEPFTSDFGRIERAPVAAVIAARNEGEVERAIVLANRLGVTLAIRGGGNSQAGQSIPLAGLSLYVGAMKEIALDVASQLATCEPGATWRELVDLSLKQQLVPTVLPLNLDLTIGGTLSAGGIGSNSHRHGTAAHHVHALEAVMGGGERLSGQREERADLFDALLGNQGQCGVATRVAVRLRRAATRVQTIALRYESLVDLLHDMNWLVRHEAPDHMEAFAGSTFLGIRRGANAYQPMRRWGFTLQLSYELEADFDPARVHQSLRAAEVLLNESADFAAYVGRYDFRFRYMKASGAWNEPHPWLEWLLPASNAVELVTSALERLPPSFGDGHRIFLLPSGGYPRFLSVPAGDPVVGFAVLPIGIPRGHLPAALSAAEAVDRALLDGGAKRYLSGWIGDRDDACWQRHYGSEYASWRGAKEKWDPRGVLRSRLFQAAR